MRGEGGREGEFASQRTHIQTFTILALSVKIDGQRQGEGRGNNLFVTSTINLGVAIHS